jgi:GNAT superfamily N-acetyltransferase
MQHRGRIEHFDRTIHDRSQFDCGNAVLNEWLHRRTTQFEKRGLSRTYVLLGADDQSIRGYYAISSHSVAYESLAKDQAKGIPQIDVPVVLLGRLAIDLRAQGQGMGEFLLIDALRRADYLSQHLGIRAVEVDAIKEAARRFYLKYGFIPLRDDPNHLFLPISVIRKLNLPPLAVD